MSENKIKIPFNTFTIDTPYILADELELNLLLGDEDHLSRSNLGSLMRIEDEEGKENERIDKKNNKIDKIWNSISSHFKMRANTLSMYYPFDFKEEEERLIPKKDCKSRPEYKLYLYFLIISQLEYLDKSSQISFAYKFEKICKIAIKGWVPHFDFKLFSANSEDRKSFFGTNLRDALVKLAEFIREEPHTKYIYKKKDNGDYHLHSHGDKGLDLVGIRTFSDNDKGRGVIKIFGQCITNQKWEKKSLETHPLNFNSYIAFSNQPINIVFIPVFYRNENGEFAKRTPVEDCLLVDRQRLLEMLNPQDISKISLEHSFEIA